MRCFCVFAREIFNAKNSHVEIFFSNYFSFVFLSNKVKINALP